MAFPGSQRTLDADYGRFEDVMSKLGYTWDAHKVQTEDDYILTLFHVTGKTDTGLFTPTEPPVLMNHGIYSDAA